MNESTRRYNYRVSWSETNLEFVARVAEWPSLAAKAPRKPDALSAIHQLVARELEK